MPSHLLIFQMVSWTAFLCPGLSQGLLDGFYLFWYVLQYLELLLFVSWSDSMSFAWLLFVLVSLKMSLVASFCPGLSQCVSWVAFFFLFCLKVLNGFSMSWSWKVPLGSGFLSVSWVVWLCPGLSQVLLKGHTVKPNKFNQLTLNVGTVLRQCK